jgi:EmrB/QacA subfamily drug resistance transporter
MALLLVSIDNTIVNVALPDIRLELGASLQSLQWIVGAYVLALGSLLLLAGSLADRMGRKRIFTAGLAIFTGASACAALAPDEGVLVAFRAVQVAGGAMMTPVALTIVSTVFTAPGARARAVGWWGAVSGIGIAVGPLLGGPLIDWFGWRSVFWVNVPLGLAAILLTTRFVPDSKPAHPRQLDPLAQVFVIGLLGSIAFAVIRFPLDGVAASTAVATVIGVTCGFALAAWERRRTDPLVDIRVFRDRVFTASFSAAFLSFFAFAGLLFANTMLLQTDQGLTATAAAIVTLPLAAAVIATGPLSGKLVARGRAQGTVFVSGWVFVVAGVGFSVAASLPVWLVAVPLAIFGVGFGLLNDPINVAAVSELPPDRAGMGAATMSSAKQVGQLFGVSVIGAALSLLGRTASPTDGAVANVVICGALCVTGVGVVLTSLLWRRDGAPWGDQRTQRQRRETRPGGQLA